MAGRERPGLAVPIALALAPTHRAAASHAGVASSATRRNTHTHTHGKRRVLVRLRGLSSFYFASMPCAVVCWLRCLFSFLLSSPNGNRRRRGAGGTSPAKRRGRDVDVIPTFAVLRLVTRGDESLKISSYLCRILKSESRGARTACPCDNFFGSPYGTLYFPS